MLPDDTLAFGLAEACGLLSECFPEISPDGQEDVNQIQTRVVNDYSGEKVKKIARDIPTLHKCKRP